MKDKPQRGVRANGQLIDSRDLHVGVSRALPSRPMPERGHHRCCQPAPTMIRTCPDRREPQPIPAAMAAGNGHQLGMIRYLIIGNSGKGPRRAAIQDHPDDPRIGRARPAALKGLFPVRLQSLLDRHPRLSRTGKQEIGQTADEHSCWLAGGDPAEIC